MQDREPGTRRVGLLEGGKTGYEMRKERVSTICQLGALHLNWGDLRIGLWCRGIGDVVGTSQLRNGNGLMATNEYNANFWVKQYRRCQQALPR